MQPEQQLPADCSRVAFDVGCHTGLDTLSFLSRGFCVISVDANPSMTSALNRSLLERGLTRNVTLLNVGLEEPRHAGQKIPFYVTSTLVHSSFDRHKATRMTRGSGSITTLQIPTLKCEELWRAVPAGVRPYWLKIDIEERHYVCVEALHRLPAEALPQYVSWEMHEFANCAHGTRPHARPFDAPPSLPLPFTCA